MIIYKITNFINKKIYIGLTTTSIQKRWNSHKAAAKNNNPKHLYRSMNTYGIDNFNIEETDNTDDFIKLGELERYYIKLYNSQDPNIGYNITSGGESNQLDANPRAKLKVEEVIQIRNIYSYNDLTCKECWKLYSDRISFSAFQKIWEGNTWASILPEVYTEYNKDIHRHQTSLLGESNGNALSTNISGLQIRKYYTNHTLEETYKKYGELYKSKVSFRRVLDTSYKEIPIYSKKYKCWKLNNKIIDINNYNPVSTIPESRE